ncbi:hypothetical protein CHUAL_002343 [Chamberlinius hualienensis]
MPYSSLKGKVAIVTGGASGIGAATAKRLASYGVILALADVNGGDLPKVAKECTEISEKFNISKPLVFVGDLSCGTTREKLMEETIATFGKLDILANVAGIGTRCSIFDKTMEKADKLFNILLIAVYDLSRLASHHLVKTKGSIINVASVWGYHGNIGIPAYAASKTGVIQMTKIVAQELGDYGVRVNSIRHNLKYLLFEITLMVNLELKYFDEDAKINSTMKRAGEPDEIAKVIAFMLSDENLYMNGSDVVVDGGFLVKMRDIPKCA